MASWQQAPRVVLRTAKNEAFSHHSGWRGSYFRITAVLQAQAAQGVRDETKVTTGRFAADVGYGNCGVENFFQR